MKKIIFKKTLKTNLKKNIKMMIFKYKKSEINNQNKIKRIILILFPCNNLKNTIKCVSLAIYYLIKNRKTNTSLEIFDEKRHPLTVSPIVDKIHLIFEPHCFVPVRSVSGFDTTYRLFVDGFACSPFEFAVGVVSV